MITITTTPTLIQVDMGAHYPNGVPFRRGTWHKSQIAYIFQNTTHIEIDASDGKDWILTFADENIGLRVATIDGIAPTSLDDLYNKLVAIL